MLKKDKGYDPEQYWSQVASEIAKREQGGLLAGDDEPYYEYKREMFLKSLLQLGDFANKTVLEIGCGPGGNILVALQAKARHVTGVDISEKMTAIAKGNIKNQNAEIIKIDGRTLPFADASFDIVFTATVLQHNSDDAMMRAILSEACRVTKNALLLCEKLDTVISGTELCVARPAEYYRQICHAHGFEQKVVKHINIRVSYYCCGVIRKLLNPSSRKEGEVITGFSRLMQKIALPVTKQLDKIFPSSKDLGFMLFIRNRA